MPQMLQLPGDEAVSASLSEQRPMNGTGSMSEKQTFVVLSHRDFWWFFITALSRLFCPMQAGLVSPSFAAVLTAPSAVPAWHVLSTE